MLKYFSENFLTKAIYFLGICLAITPGIFDNQTIYPYIISKTIVFRIIVAIILFFYTLLILKNKEYLPSKNNLLKCFFLFVVSCLISGLLSQDRSQSFWSTPERMMGTYNMFHFFVMIVILSSVIKIKEKWFELLNIWNYLIASATVVSFIVFAINHMIKGTSIFIDRFYGFAGNPIFFASIVLVFFYINLYLFFERIQQQKINKLYIWNILIALSYFGTIILTGSRGALLALGVSGIVLFISLIVNPCEDLNYLFKINVQRLVLIVFTSLILISGTVFMLKNTKLISNNYILKRLTTFQIAENSAFSRIIVSKIALTCFIQRPIIGYGFDNFENCYQQNFDPLIVKVLPSENRFDKAHNMPFEILATVGIIGFVFYMGIYVLMYKNIRDLMLNDKISFYSGLSIILAIVAYFLQNLFVFDVFEGFLSLCLLTALTISLSNNKTFNFKWNLNQKTKEIITWIAFVLISLNIFWFNIYIWDNLSLVGKVDRLVKKEKVDSALQIIKDLKHKKTPYALELYYGFFDVFIKNQKTVGLQNLKDYYDLAYENQKIYWTKYPWRARSYLAQMVHIASKAINPDINVSAQDVAHADDIMKRIKKYHLTLPESDFFFEEILFNSKDKNDWARGEALALKDMELYPEMPKFYWVYGIHMANTRKQPDIGMKYIKKAFDKNIQLESIAQLMTTVKIFNDNNDPDFVIEMLNKYLPSNQNRYNLYVELGLAYIQKKDWKTATEAFNRASKIYLSNRTYEYSSKAEKELLNLENKIKELKLLNP